MIARGELVPKTLADLEREEAEANFRRLLRRGCPPIETLQLTPGTARWAFEHARRGLPVPRVSPPVEQLLDASARDKV